MKDAPLFPEDPRTKADDLSAVLEQLRPSERHDARKMSEEIRIDDDRSVTEFGMDVQEEISEFAGNLLEQVRTRDTEEIGEFVTELMLKIKGVDVQKLQDRPGRLSRLPWVGNWFGQMGKVMSQYQKVESQLDEIRAKLDEVYVELQKDTETLDILLKKNYEYFRKLDVRIAAVQIRLEQLYEEEMPAFKSRAEAGDDPFLTQRWNELNHFAGRLEKKLDDFKRARFLSLSQAPRIKLLQQGDQMIMEKIQSVTYHLIPLWKMELVTALAQQRASRSLKLQREVRETIEESMRRSVVQMREVSAEIGRENETGLVSMETMRHVHEQLIATLEETRQALADGRKQRKEAEAEMLKMEAQWKQKIAEMAGRSPKNVPPPSEKAEH